MRTRTNPILIAFIGTFFIIFLVFIIAVSIRISQVYKETSILKDQVVMLQEVINRSSFLAVGRGDNNRISDTDRKLHEQMLYLQNDLNEQRTDFEEWKRSFHQYFDGIQEQYLKTHK